MVWQDYYSPDDVCKLREPLDAEIERLRSAVSRVREVVDEHASRGIGQRILDALQVEESNK